jgi:hypothetical protein
MELKHPSWYKALRKQRKEFEASERAQADKRASKLASEQTGGRVGPRVTSMTTIPSHRPSVTDNPMTVKKFICIKVK